jgi:hypothetical protein
MSFLLASAERTDLSGSGWSIILMGLAVLVGVTVLTAIPIALARRRGLRRAEGITVGMIFWGVVSAGSVIWACLARMQWAKNYQTNLMTGYADPRDLSNQPAWPWGLWAVLAVVFCAILAGCLAGRPSPPTEE